MAYTQNEALLKAMCHNILLLNELRHHRGIKVDFGMSGDIPILRELPSENDTSLFTMTPPQRALSQWIVSSNTSSPMKLTENKKMRRKKRPSTDPTRRCSLCGKKTTAIKDGKPFWPIA